MEISNYTMPGYIKYAALGVLNVLHAQSKVLCLCTLYETVENPYLFQTAMYNDFRFKQVHDIF